MNEILAILQQISDKLNQTGNKLADLVNRLRSNWMTDYFQARRRLIIPHGLDADKATLPKAGEIYRATDTHILYTCDEDGSWTEGSIQGAGYSQARYGEQVYQSDKKGIYGVGKYGEVVYV